MTPVERIFNSSYGVQLYLKKPKKDKNGNPQYLTAEALKRLDWMNYEEQWYASIGIERYGKIVDAIAKECAVKFSVSETEIKDSITNSVYN